MADTVTPPKPQKSNESASWLPRPAEDKPETPHWTLSFERLSGLLQN